MFWSIIGAFLFITVGIPIICFIGFLLLVFIVSVTEEYKKKKKQG